MQILLRIFLGTAAASIFCGICWFGFSFLAPNSTSSFPLPMSGGREPLLSAIIGAIFGGIVGFISSLITCLAKTYWNTSFGIGVIVGLIPVIGLFMGPSGGMPNYLTYSMLSMVPASVIAALIGSSQKKQQK